MYYTFMNSAHLKYEVTVSKRTTNFYSTLQTTKQKKYPLLHTNCQTPAQVAST
jgi:hypothetical protein